MARRKNVKRIDPRYFLHETVNRGEELEEAEFQDTGFGEEDIEVNRAAASSGFEEMQAQQKILNDVVAAAVEAVGDWIDDEDSDWPKPGVDDRKTFLKKLDQYSQTYAGVSVADVLGYERRLEAGLAEEEYLAEGKEEAKDLYLMLVKYPPNHDDWKGGYNKIILGLTTGGGMIVDDVEVPSYGLKNLHSFKKGRFDGVTAEDAKMIKKYILDNPESAPGAAKLIQDYENKFASLAKGGREKDIEDYAFLRMWNKANRQSRAASAGDAFDAAFGE